MAKWYSKWVWSNCLIQAIIAKIKNPRIRWIFLPSRSKYIPFFHIAWTDGYAEYSFESPDPIHHVWECFIYYGTIKKHSIGWSHKYAYWVKHDSLSVSRPLFMIQDSTRK